MSSRRFPGKVLAPLGGRPIVARVIDVAAEVVPSAAITVLTSVDPADDPLARFVESLGVAVFRGSLDDVFGRFRAAEAAQPCDRFTRLCADSPLIEPAMIADAIARAESSDADLVTNIFPRTFPKGQSVEVVRSARFREIDAAALSADEREHVTQVYYRHPERFRIDNIICADPAAAGTSLAVDSIEDLQRLERLIAIGMPRP